jgi:hypothetical protein
VSQIQNSILKRSWLWACVLAVASVLSSVGQTVAPVILAQPESQTNVVGDAIILSVDVSSNTTDTAACPVTYQWRKNGSKLTGETNSFFYIESVRTTDVGSYTVAVSNCAGGLVSASAVLTVYVPPAIAFGGNPVSKTLLVGSNLTGTSSFTVKAATTPTPTQPLTYQWFRDGEALTNNARISGATSTNLTILNLTAEDEGDYWATISNPATALTGEDAYSLPATLTIVYPPKINSFSVIPDDARPEQGEFAIFTVEAEGSDDLRYIWKLNGNILAGETDEVLAVYDAMPGDEGNYSVEVRSSAVDAISSQIIKATNPPIFLTVLVPPTITLEPQDKTVSTGAAVAFTVKVNTTATAPLGYQWAFNGEAIPGATTSAHSFTATSTTQSGFYSVTISNEADSVESRDAELRVIAETEKPTITIVSPVENSRNSNGVLVVRGTAADNAQVSEVFWTLNQTMTEANQSLAEGTTSWIATVPFTTPGTNTFRVRSRDSSGNYSSVQTRKFIYVRSDKLTLITNGVGSVTPNSGGQLLEIGKQYTLTARPGIGQVFSQWSGGMTSTNPVISFTMRSNLVLQANFIPNPFIPRKGTYSGLFYRVGSENEPFIEHPSSGYFSLTLTDKGVFSCKLQIGSAKYPCAGIFSINGTASATITRVGLSPLRVTLAMDVDNQTDEISGTVSDGSWVAQLSGDRAVFNAALNPAPKSGKYTIAFISQSGSDTIPNGDGFGNVTVDAGGKIGLKGTFADGTKVNQKAFISKNGQWPFYGSLYAGQGSTIGWLLFTNTGSSSIEGNVSWIKTGAAIAKNYPGGFTTDVTAAGSRYWSPVPGERVLNLAAPIVALTGGGLSADITNNAVLNANNTITISSNSNRVALTIAPTTGAVKGSFIFPGTALSTPIKGIVLREQNEIRGFFLTPTKSGRVILRDP